MNCRQARALFSSRLDNEMSPQDALRLQDHLGACADCCAKWDSFELTVRMVRSLPQVAPDSNFVGQVLDRVRGYEAERQAAVQVRFGLVDRLKAALDTILDPGFWTRLVVPARLAGAVAFGVATGFVVSERHLIPFPGQHARQPIYATQQGSAPAMTGRAAQQNRPFADLVGIAQDRSDSTGPSAPRTESDPVQANPTGPGRMVNLNASDGRITF